MNRTYVVTNEQPAPDNGPDVTGWGGPPPMKYLLAIVLGVVMACSNVMGATASKGTPASTEPTVEAVDDGPDPFGSHPSKVEYADVACEWWMQCAMHVQEVCVMNNSQASTAAIVMRTRKNGTETKDRCEGACTNGMVVSSSCRATPIGWQLTCNIEEGDVKYE